MYHKRCHDSFIKARHYSSVRRKYASPGSSKYFKSTKKSNEQRESKKPCQSSSIQQTQWINAIANSITTAVSFLLLFTTMAAIRVLQFIIVLIRISVMALLTLMAFALRTFAYVVNFFLTDSIWLSMKLCLYALFSLKVARLYKADTPIVAFFGVFSVIVFLMECPTANAMPISDQERRERDKARKRLKRQNETAEERSNRLQSERERWASTSHERNERRRSKRKSETNEQNALRRLKARERWSIIGQQQNQRRRSERKEEWEQWLKLTKEQQEQHHDPYLKKPNFKKEDNGSGTTDGRSGDHIEKNDDSYQIGK